MLASVVRGFFFALIVCLKPSYANPTPLEWISGSVGLSEGGIRLERAGSDAIVLANLIYDRFESDETASRRPRVQHRLLFQNLDGEEARERVFYKSLPEPERGFFPDVNVAWWLDANKKHGRVVWMLQSRRRTSEAPRGSWLLFHRIERLDSGAYKVVPSSVKGANDFSTTEPTTSAFFTRAALVSTNGHHFYFLATRTGDKVTALAVKQDGRGGVMQRVLQLDGSRSFVLLPDGLKDISFSLDTKTEMPQLVAQASNLERKELRYALTVPKRNLSVVPPNSASTVSWLSGAKAIRARMTQIVTEAELPEKPVDSELVQPLLRVHLASSAKGIPFVREGFHLVQQPQAVTQANPALAASLVDALTKAWTEKHPDSESLLSFVRVTAQPRRSVSAQTVAEEIRYALANAASAPSEGQVVRRHLFIADLTGVASELVFGAVSKLFAAGDFPRSQETEYGIVLLGDFSSGGAYGTSWVQSELQNPIPVETYLTANGGYDTLHKMLLGAPYEISGLSLKQVSAVGQEVTARSEQLPYRNLLDAARYFAATFRFDSGDSSVENMEKLARGYLRLNGVQPPPRLTPSDIAEIRRVANALSARSPLRGPQAFLGLDEITPEVVNHIAVWGGYLNQTSQPTLLIPFVGDAGVGKTNFAKRLVASMGSLAHARYTNLTTLRSSLEAGSAPTLAQGKKGTDDEEAKKRRESIATQMLDYIQQEADAVRISGAKVPVLILDEVHLEPQVLRALLPSAGDGDRQGAFLKLEGIVVIPILNCDVALEAYEALSGLTPKSDGYQKLVGELLIATLRGLLDVKILRPLVSRLVLNAFFFPNRTENVDELKILIADIVQEFEASEKVVISLSDPAMAFLLARLEKYRTLGAYRTVRRAMEREIALLITELLRGDDAALVAGSEWVVRSHQTHQGQLELFRLDDSNDEGAYWRIETVRKTFGTRLDEALGAVIYQEEWQQSGRRMPPTVESSMRLKIARMLKDGLKVAFLKPFGPREKLPELPLPSVANITARGWDSLQASLREPIDRIATAIDGNLKYARTTLASDAKAGNEQAEMRAEAFRVMAMVFHVFRKGQASQPVSLEALDSVVKYLGPEFTDEKDPDRILVFLAARVIDFHVRSWAYQHWKKRNVRDGAETTNAPVGQECPSLLDREFANGSAFVDELFKSK